MQNFKIKKLTAFCCATRKMMISLASAVLLQFNQVGTEINARNPERRKNVISSHGICAKKTPN